ncbi:hypothetical protein LWM68_44725 [Niabella sp. W65]|nr:hypothetical protein [Niabella sp. W65]MCH7369213.1 hypothetical protein [Niabella sp. W65]
MRADARSSPTGIAGLSFFLQETKAKMVAVASARGNNIFFITMGFYVFKLVYRYIRHQKQLLPHNWKSFIFSFQQGKNSNNRRYNRQGYKIPVATRLFVLEQDRVIFSWYSSAAQSQGF